MRIHCPLLPLSTRERQRDNLFIRAPVPGSPLMPVFFVNSSLGALFVAGHLKFLRPVLCIGYNLVVQMPPNPLELPLAQVSGAAAERSACLQRRELPSVGDLYGLTPEEVKIVESASVKTSAERGAAK
jgi:hypothetical protein